MDVELDPASQALLRDFLGAMESVGGTCFLVGAGARVLGFDQRWDLRGARATLDWDFAVRAESWEHWRRLSAVLTEGPRARFRTVGGPLHRFRHVAGSVLDLVPFGGVEATPGEITWPDSSRMSVRGFAEALDACDHIETTSGLIVPVAAVPSLAILKLHAYQDRRARGERKDIQDFQWLARHYEAAGNEVRLHEELGDLLRDAALDVEVGGAALMGLDAARLHGPESTDVLRGLFAEARDPWSPIVTDSLQRGVVVDDGEAMVRRVECSRRLQAFDLGLGLGRTRGIR